MIAATTTMLIFQLIFQAVLHLGNLYEVNAEDVHTTEYCLNEVFDPKCLNNEVIVMSSATYGRMRIGRCLEAEGDVSSFGTGPDILGCSVDVLQTFDERCSLKNSCEVPLVAFDHFLNKEKPCHLALKSYLDASYDCFTVIEDDRSCVVSATGNLQNIRHLTRTKANCGTKSQPWLIEAPSGQQIQLSLLDLNYKMRDLININCHQYGYIIDGLSNKNTSICGLNNERKKIIYQSVSHVIKIVLTTSKHFEHNQDVSQVLLGFRASGCSNIVPPEDTWLSRKENEAIVGCYSSHQTWLLQCVGQQWIGVIGNCTREASESKRGIGMERNSVINYQVMVTVAIAFIGILICVTIVITGAVCLKRYSITSHREYCHQTGEKSSTSQRGINISGHSALLA